MLGRAVADLLVLDAVLLKAAGAPEEGSFRNLELRLFQALGRSWIARAVAARDAGLNVLDTDGLDAPPTEADVDQVLDRLEEGFRPWPAEVRPAVAAVLDEAYRAARAQLLRRANGTAPPIRPDSPHLVAARLVRKAGEDDDEDGPKKKKPKGAPKRRALEVRPSFDVQDEDAIEALTRRQVFWVGRHYDENLSARVAAVTREVMLQRGLGRRDAARHLRAALDAEFGIVPEGELERAGISLPKGWTGTSAQYFEGLAANTVTVGRVHGAVRTLSEVGATHYEIVNPIDERTCKRCNFMDGRTFETRRAIAVTEAELDARDPDAVKRAHPWAGSAKELERAAASTGGLEAAGFVIPPFHFRCRCTVDISATSEFVPEVRERGFPWKEGQLTEVKRPIAGAHEKVLFRDPEGSEWLFKPQEDFRAVVDVTAADVARALELETPDVFLVKLRGRSGSIQRMYSGVDELGAAAPEALAAEQAAVIQREHAFDWLVSQHDTHGGNILRAGDGSLRFIDKGQAFRFFGEDPLDLEFGAPGTPNPTGTYYQRMLKAYADGKDVKLDRKVLDEFLDRVEALPDDEYVNLLRPYARAASEAAKRDPSLARASWMGRMDEEKFLRTALARKQNLRASVDAFYEDLEERRARSLASLGRGAQPKARLKAWRDRLAEGDEAGFAGRSFFVGGADYENMNWLTYGADGDGTFFEAKLRAGADRRLMALISQEPAAIDLGGPVAEKMWSDTLSIAKSFNKHGGAVPDGSTADKLYDLTRTALKDLVAKGGPEGKMAQHYLTYLDEILGEDGKWVKGALGKEVKRWVPDLADLPKPKALPAGWKATKVGRSDPIRRRLQRGRISVSGDSPAGAEVPDNVGPIYELTTPEGAKVFYQPHGAGVHFAAQGRFRVWVDEGMKTLDPAKVDRVFESLRDLGLETAEATTDDLDLLYLRKVAFKQKLDAAALAAVPDDLPVAEQLTRMRTFLRDSGVNLPAKYKFQPRWDGKDGVGFPRWLGEHVPGEDRKGLQLYHSTYGDMAEQLDIILGGGTRKMATTMEKIRWGVPVGGMSPEADIGTGGANYFFTRVRTSRSRKPGLYFDGDLLTDLDAVTYDGDVFGNVQSSVLETRKTSSSWKELSARDGSDETILKNGVGVDRWLSRVVVNNEAEKAKVIAVLEKNGVKQLGGKPLDQAVTVK